MIMHVDTYNIINKVCNSQPGMKSLISLLYSNVLLGISPGNICGRVEFSAKLLLVNLMKTPVFPACRRS